MKVLFTTPQIEYPAAGGPKLRIENSVKALNLVSELHIIPRVFQREMGGNTAEQFYRGHSYNLAYIPSVDTFSDNRYLNKLCRIINSFFNKDIDFILRYIDKHSINIIWFGYGNVSFPLIKEIKNKRPDLKVVCDTDSVWSRFVLRELPYEQSPERRRQIALEGQEKEKEEAEWVNLCDITTAVSEIDAEYYRSLAKEPERIMTFSNVIDINNYINSPAPPNNFKKPCMYLAGSFWPNSPMEMAAKWVFNEVMPLVRDQIPGLHFYIIGQGSNDILADIKRADITITGRLETVLPYLCHTDVALVPLMFESGTRYKILEAGACKIPIVSTTLGAEGIPVQHGKDVLLADTPEDFADAIIQIIKDPGLAKRLSDNCYKLVEDKYSISSAVEEAKSILSKVSEKNG